MDKILTPGQDGYFWYGTEWAGVDPQQELRCGIQQMRKENA